MNKKFLSAILFGALMVSSTGTFVSCKDSDDDIDRIDNTLNDLKSQIAALQTEVANGNWVTSVTPTEGGFTVVFKDGKTYTIVNGKDGEKGDKGEDGKGTEVTVKDGYWYIDGEKTDYLAVTSEDLKEVKVPYINEEDGYWYFYNDKGEAEKSPYKATGAAYAVNDGGVFTLYMPDANGVMQTIKLPTAASAISSIEFLDNDYQAIKNLNEITLLYWDAAATTEWKGPRGNISNNITTYSTDLSGNNNVLYTRIAPSSVDASELAFSLIDTKDNVASIALAAKKYDGMLTRAAENGLYDITVVPGSYADGGDANKLANQFLSSGANKAMALKPATANYRSLFNVKVIPDKRTTAPLTNINLNGNYVTIVGVDKTTGVAYQTKVGQEVVVSVTKECNLYDMYLSASEEDKALFGIIFSEDGRSFKATKSPDNVTDATIDLEVYTLPNIGGNSNIKKTTIRVEINRTLGEATYDKQTKQPNKTNYSFLVSADKLKASLSSDLNAWYASVKTDVNVLQNIYDDEACTVISDLGTNGGATTNMNNKQVAVTMNVDNDNQVTPANIATKLNYLKFQLDINKTVKPLKIGKTYYAKLSFVDKTSNIELNYVVVPFELTKPELNTILVKESGVFRDGKDLAQAYMYWGDAKTKVTGKSYYQSNYYIDRAFTDMQKKLSDAKMVTSPTFAIDDANNVLDAEGKDTGKKASYFASIVNPVPSSTNRAHVSLKEDTDGNGSRDVAGYKKDLNVKFTGAYLDVTGDDSWKYAKTYQFRVMSPILEGEAVAANNVVEVSATGRTKLYKENIWAKTYNNDVKYDIFAKGEAAGVIEWYRSDIANVTFSTGNKNVFEVTVATPTVPVAATATAPAVDSYIEVEGVTENTAKLKVAVDDIWGYTLNSSVDIKTTLNTGK